MRDYREYLKEVLSQRKTLDSKFRLHQAAAYVGIQNTYLSNVLAKRVHLSADQLFLLSEFLGLKEKESQYLMNLMEWARSSVAQRKKRLKSEILAYEQSQKQAKSHLKATAHHPDSMELASYYLDPLLGVIHVFLQIERFAKQPEEIKRALRLSDTYFIQAIHQLERIGYIKSTGEGGYEVLVKNRHLPADSILCLPHQTLLRAKSQERIMETSSSERQSVSVTFSTEDEQVDKIKVLFLDFLSSAEKLVSRKPGEKVYQLNFDLFPWSGE